MKTVGLLLLLAAVGCATDTTAPFGPVGTFLLESKNGVALPVTELSNQWQVTTNSDMWTVNQDGSWKEVIRQSLFRATDSLRSSMENNSWGTWAVKGDTITFYDVSGDPSYTVRAVLTGIGLRQTIGTDTLIYRRWH
jgi:hypothetical protein